MRRHVHRDRLSSSFSKTSSSSRYFYTADTVFSMPSSNKDKIISKAVMVSSQGDDTLHSSKLPLPLKFPLLVILSLSLSSLLYSFAAQYNAEELAAVSRNLNNWWEVGVLVTWR